MAAPIKYTDIYLYSTTNIKSTEVRMHLDASFIKYINLQYVGEDYIRNALEPLSTWFRRNNEPIIFTELPIIIFDKVYWISDDGEEVFKKRDFAFGIDDLPVDFISKSDKL